MHQTRLYLNVMSPIIAFNYTSYNCVFPEMCSFLISIKDNF